MSVKIRVPQYFGTARHKVIAIYVYCNFRTPLPIRSKGLCDQDRPKDAHLKRDLVLEIVPKMHLKRILNLKMVPKMRFGPPKYHPRCA